MKRIAIVGHPDNIDLIQGVIDKNFQGVEGIPVETKEMGQIETTINYLSEHINDFDGILFTGKILYDIMNHRMHSQNPWVYMDNDAGQLQRVLLEARIKHNYDITNISIDSYNEDQVKEIYKDIGFSTNEYAANISNIDIFGLTLIEDLIEFHKLNCINHENSFAITGISAVYKKLIADNIKCLMLKPNEAAISNKLHELLQKIKYEDMAVSQIVVISVEIDPSGEYDWTSENEYSNMLQKTRITEEVYKFAQRIQAAVVETERSYLLFTTKQIVEFETKNLRELSILKAVQKKTNNTVSVGIGFGITAREAKLNAVIGKNKSLNMGGNQCFVMYSRKHFERITPLDKANEDEIPHGDTSFKEISDRSGLSVNNIYKLKSIMDIYKKDTFTSLELAEEFGNSLRSMNRIIEKLENAGYVEIIGKKILGKSGRPSRILKLLI